MHAKLPSDGICNLYQFVSGSCWHWLVDGDISSRTYNEHIGILKLQASTPSLRRDHRAQNRMKDRTAMRKKLR